MSYTPGPWAFGSFHRLLVVPVADGKPNKHCPIADLGEISTPWDATEDSAERYDNAALIAAAPDLLEALKVAMGHIEMSKLEISHCKDAAMIRAAIAKAEGSQT